MVTNHRRVPEATETTVVAKAETMVCAETKASVASDTTVAVSPETVGIGVDASVDGDVGDAVASYDRNHGQTAVHTVSS